MIVIGHEAVANESYIEESGGFLYRFKEDLVVVINKIDLLTTGASVHDVVESVGILYSKRPGHGQKLTEDGHAVKKRLDPFMLHYDKKTLQWSAKFRRNK